MPPAVISQVEEGATQLGLHSTADTGLAFASPAKFRHAQAVHHDHQVAAGLRESGTQCGLFQRQALAVGAQLHGNGKAIGARLQVVAANAI